VATSGKDAARRAARPWRLAAACATCRPDPTDLLRDGPVDEKHAIRTDRDCIVADRLLGVVPPEELAAGGIENKVRIRLAPQFAHVGADVGVADLMVWIGKRAEEELAARSDVAPLSGLTVSAGRSGKFAGFFAGRGIEAIAALLVVNEHAGSRDAEVAAGDRGAVQVIGVVRGLDVGQRELPEVAAVVRIDGPQRPHPLDEHPSFEKQRCVAAAVALRHLKIDIAKPERSKLTLHDFVGRAARVAEV
jgi:hypothetical protein